MNFSREKPLCLYCQSEMTEKGGIEVKRITEIFTEVSSLQKDLTIFECQNCGNSQLFNNDQLNLFLRK